MFRASPCPSSGATTTAVAASGLPTELGDSSVVGRGRAGPARPRPTALLPPRSNGIPETAAVVDRLLMMGIRLSEICWAVFKQVINLRSCCILLVDWVESMMTHGLENPKFTSRYGVTFHKSWIFRVKPIPISVVQSDLDTTVSALRDEQQYVQSEEKEDQILFSGCGENEGTEDVIGRLKVLAEEKENKTNKDDSWEREESEMWYFEEQKGTKTNMKLVIWCFVSGESQSAVVRREERQTKA